jgi:hypothetical protein
MLISAGGMYVCVCIGRGVCVCVCVCVCMCVCVCVYSFRRQSKEPRTKILFQWTFTTMFHVSNTKNYSYKHRIYRIQRYLFLYDNFVYYLITDIPCLLLWYAVTTATGNLIPLFSNKISFSIQFIEISSSLP